MRCAAARKVTYHERSVLLVRRAISQVQLEAAACIASGYLPREGRFGIGGQAAEADSRCPCTCCRPIFGPLMHFPEGACLLPGCTKGIPACAHLLAANAIDKPAHSALVDSAALPNALHRIDESPAELRLRRALSVPGRAAGTS
jgi:hypothetical protein